MQSAAQKVLVVGGNGFLGSAVCRAALARGMQVTSISSSGKPYTTPKGHSPAWTSKVNWQAGNALQPETYAYLLPGSTAVVHTLGTLLEDARYKSALRESNLPALLGTFAARLASLDPGSRNPLEDPEKEGGYERMNRDSALRVCEAFAATESEIPLDGPRPFVFVSAEDVFRPFIPTRYIETKREAEMYIEGILGRTKNFRGVYIRPSLIYHPHFRPLTSPLAAILDLSASLHAQAPRGFPTPANILKALSSGTRSDSLIPPSPLDSVACALTIPPIHVDHVAEAICIAVDNARSDVRGVVGVREMRELIGWSLKGSSAPPLSNSAHKQQTL
ncbi:mitochondrial protein [Cristinia sonorae]|uniref:Mitochondrial protein n=1 Tax=Cristinia sonorae TaxID=1940300 RepID=A0A8K0UXF7_9AGAR|nr:mitochondrial protein [Cristinia sonorae]